MGRIIHRPKAESPIIMECSVTDFDQSLKHTKKRQLKGDFRVEVAKQLVEGNELPCSWRRPEADRLMQAGDNKPPHIFSSHVLRKAKQQRHDKSLGVNTNNVFEAFAVSFFI